MNKHKYLLAPDSAIALPTPPAPEGVVVQGGQSANLNQVLATEAPAVNAPPAVSTPNTPEPTLADFDAAANGNPVKIQLPPKPAPEPKVEPVVKPADPKPPVDTKPATQPDPAKPALPPIQIKPKIDPATQPEYVGLTDEEVKIFKSMSVEAKKVLRPIYDEHKAQKATIKDLESKLATAPKLIDGVPLNYMEHQEAYTLTPQYKAAIKQHQLATFENEHWAKQLASIEAGKPAKTLLYNAETGKYSYGDDLPPTPEAKASVIRQMNATQQWQSQVAHQANQLAANHGAEYQKAIQFVKKVEDEFFPFFAKDDHEYVPLIKQVVQQLPEIYQSHPLAIIIGKSYAVTQELMKQLAEAKAQGGQQAQGQSDATKAGPTLQQTNSVVTAPAKTEPTDDEVRQMFANMTKRV